MMPPTAVQPQVLDVRSDVHRRQRGYEAMLGAAGAVVVAAGVPSPRGPLPIGREEKARPAGRPGVPDDGGAARNVRPAASTRPSGSPNRAGTDVLRIVSDPRTPVFVTEHANGRRVYGYWRPLDADSGRGGCYVALSATECDALYAAGRITVGEPVTDPTKTTYRVRAARTRTTGARPAAAPVPTTAARGRAA
ncbi:MULTISPECIES: cell envelope biogenesis protein OmpA [unclassified Streptomyces]|uniref:cell envelope biogenesis protein OmpA n=1 Tax=unclassified Streptomyces TaxID=2593676 RepID=UPI00381D4320